MIRTLGASALAAVLLHAVAAYAQDTDMPSSPDFSESAGLWNVEGFALGRGNTIVCKIQKEAADGSPFAYMSMISAGSDGTTLIDAYVTKTALPEGSVPTVTIYFDGKKAVELTGGVEKGYLHTDIAKLAPVTMKRIIEFFIRSSSLVEIASFRGLPSEKTTVDLTDSDAAFTKRGICAKAVMEVGMERMRNGG
jgi:hypothetical protein